MNDIQKELEKLKVDREVDEHNESHEFRLGYVKATCHAINLVKNLDIPRVINWALISKEEYPKDEWLLIVTIDKAHHVAYYSSTYNKWIANSKFGDKPLWWATLPDPPCL